MKALKRVFYTFLFVICIGALGYMMINYYSYVFAKTIEGQVYEIERVTQPTMVVTGQTTVGTADSSILYSFAVAIRDTTGKIYTASSTDRQWAVVHKGMCVEAKIYPYPPWDLEKGNTYFNARLLSQRECPAEYPKVTPAAAPASGAENTQSAPKADEAAPSESPK